jgi:hypothetical protein
MSAAWYAVQYNTVLSGDERVDDISSDNETAAMAVHIAQGDADFCVWCSRRQGEVCGCFAMLEAARAAAVYPYTLTHDVEGFEMRLDLFRRYAVAAIRDRSTHGDAVAVERGRGLFDVLYKQGVNAAERVGNHAYAAMVRCQREMFYRALSDQATPPSLEEESGLLPPQPVDSDVAVRAMPVHELIVEFFLTHASEGLSFYEAMECLPWFATSQRAEQGRRILS